MSCPSKNDEQFSLLKEHLGKPEAYALYNANKEVIPDISVVNVGGENKKSLLYEDLRREHGTGQAVMMKAYTYTDEFKAFHKANAFFPDENGEPEYTYVQRAWKSHTEGKKQTAKAYKINSHIRFFGQTSNLLIREIMQSINKGAKIKTSDVYDRFLKKLGVEYEKEKSLFAKTGDVKHQKRGAVIGGIIGDWSTITRMVDNKLSQMKLLKRTSVDDDVFEGIDNQDKDGFGGSHLEKNPNGKVGYELRRFLSDIDDYDGNKKKIAYTGDVMAVPYEKVYNTLIRLTSDMGSDFNTLIATLENHRGVPWIGDTIDKLKDADYKIKKQFCKSMSNTEVVSIRFRMYDNSSTIKGEYANANQARQVTLSRYQSGLKTSALITTDSDGVAIVDKAKASVWAKELKERTPQNVKEWLDKAGVMVRLDTLNYIEKNGLFVGNKRYLWDELWDTEYGVFKILIKNITKPKANLDIMSPVYGGVFNQLAKIDSLFEEASPNGSYRDNGKNIYPINNNHALSLHVKNLKGLDNTKNVFSYCGLRPDGTANDAYSYNSFWGSRMLSGENINLASDMTVNFDVIIPSQAPFGSGFKKTEKDWSQLSPQEVEQFSVSAMYGSGEPFINLTGGDDRVIFTMGLSNGKETPVMFRHMAMPIGFKDGQIDNGTLDMLYRQLVLPDLRRIRAIEKSGKSMNDGWNKFYTIPALNKILLTNGKLNPDAESDLKPQVMREISNLITAKVQDKIATWNEYGIGEKTERDGVTRYSGFDNEAISELGWEGDVVQNLATDFVIQNLVSNANQMMLFSGDPANYWNGSIEGTFDNMNKRLTGLVAPHTNHEYDSNENTIRYLVLMDKKRNIKKFDKTLGDRSKPYHDVTATDGQEYWSVSEALRHFKNEGQLPEGFYEKVTGIINEEVSNDRYDYDQAVLKGLNSEWADIYNGIIFNSFKPVYFSNGYDSDLQMHRVSYIKTSAIVLSPSLTAGKQLHNLRVMMEKHGIHRASYNSGVKLGANEALDIWDGDNIKIVDPTNSILELDREYSGIQQHVPLHEDNKMGRVGQVLQNLFINFDGVDGFVYNGKKWNGADLKKEFHGLVGQLYEQEWSNLKAEIGFYQVGDSYRMDVQKLKKLLISEATRMGGYNIDELNALFDDGAYKFLPYDRLSVKHEQYLNSIVWNRVINFSMPGRSCVLASSVGLQKLDDVITTEKNIVFSDQYDSKKGLQLVEKNGTYVAQVIMPWTFKGDIKHFMLPNGTFDSKKLEGVLEGFGMRIPNNGHNSQVLFEVVGFSPKNSGDVVFAPDDLIARTGWDFDVDKLYTYLYEHDVVDGNVVKKDSLRNKIIDVHVAVHKNPNEKVQRQINMPLSPIEYGDIANKIYGGKKDKNTYLSDDYQKYLMSQGATSKKLVGVYAQLCSLLGICQGHGLTTEKPMIFGDYTSDGSLFESEEILQIVSTIFQAAVDDVKNKMLFKTNDNMITVGATSAMIARGVPLEYILTFRSQPIITAYLEGADALKKYKKSLGRIPKEVRDRLDEIADNITQDDLWSNINGKVNPHIQLAVLERFKQLKKEGKNITTLGMAVNAYSKGNGANIHESIAKENAVKNLGVIKNASNVLGIVDNETGVLTKPNTIAGFAMYHGVMNNNKMWSMVYPYKTVLFKELISRASDIEGDMDADARRDLFEDWKAFAYTSTYAGILKNTDFKRLFIDEFQRDDNGYVLDEDGDKIPTNISLAKRLQKLTKKYPNNALLGRLVYNIKSNGSRSTFKYGATYDINTDQLEIQSILEGWLNNESDIEEGYSWSDLANDIILSQYAMGGSQTAGNIFKYIPWTWYYRNGLVERMSKLEYGYTEGNIDAFIEQRYQNNPRLVKKQIHKIKWIKNEVVNENGEKTTSTTIDPKDKVKSFKNGIMEYELEDEEEDAKSPPKYMAVFNRKAQLRNQKSRDNLHEMALLKFVEMRRGIAIYKVLHTLGDGDGYEFNANTVGIMKSAIKWNNVSDNIWENSKPSVVIPQTGNTDVITMTDDVSNGESNTVEQRNEERTKKDDEKNDKFCGLPRK